MSPSVLSGRNHPNDCGCCTGLTAETPALVVNRPGLSAISYRAGTHSRFKESMLAALYSAKFPVVKELRTRSDDDFTIALLDAAAMVADVLTFYQERLANESFLRTATERRSLLELARLIGYELRPGVAASTYLAFTLEEAPGAPRQTVIDIGTKVQSVPGPGEKPQTFETIEKIEARAEWNAIRPRLTRRHPIEGHTTKPLLFEGIATGLKPGDGLLFLPNDGSEPVFRQVTEVILQSIQQRTEVKLEALPVFKSTLVPPSLINAPVMGQQSNSLSPITSKYLNKTLASADLKAASFVERFNVKDIFKNLIATRQPPPSVLAFRTRAAIFGHNAPRWDSLPASQRYGEYGPNGTDPNNPQWGFIGGAYFGRKDTWAEEKLNHYNGEPPDTNHIYLDQTYAGIVKNSWVVLKDDHAAVSYQIDDIVDLSKADFALSAKVSRLTVSPASEFQNFGIRTTTVFAQSNELELARLPIEEPVSGPEIELVGWVDGLFEGQFIMVCGELETMRGVSACEYVTILTVDEVLESEGFTRITVTGLMNAYIRETVTINANVTAATHGETVQEVLGGGDASEPYQSFNLRQPPLTHVSAANANGAESTLRVRINDLLWHEAPTLYGHEPQEHIYVTRLDNEGKTTVQFGNGVTGARLPSGQENVRALYRKGIGLEGLVKAGQLSMLLTRPLGVKGVINPLDASGAQDPEQIDDARANAPLKVLTLERVVSLIDYENFARAFGGIAKALATWTWDGCSRGVMVTVAGPNGAAVEAGSATYDNLLAAMRAAGDPFVQLRVKTFRPAYFRFAGNVKINPDFESEKVLAAVEQALRKSFSFVARGFGQPVMLSEVIAVIQAVPGVIAVDVDKLYRSGNDSLQQRLLAELPVVSPNGQPSAAELLTLDAAPLDQLGVMV